MKNIRRLTKILLILNACFACSSTIQFNIFEPVESGCDMIASFNYSTLLQLEKINVNYYKHHLSNLFTNRSLLAVAVRDKYQLVFIELENHLVYKQYLLKVNNFIKQQVLKN